MPFWDDLACADLTALAMLIGSVCGVFDGNPPEADERFFEQLKKVTVEDVEQLKHQVFQHDDHLIVIVE